jgi:hypothetical protein
LGGDWNTVSPGTAGWSVVEVAQDGRVEIKLPAEGLAGSPDLPLGSSFDAKAGVFYWQPGPGFLGAFDLMFGAVPVRVVVGPPMRMAVDAPAVNRAVQQPFWVSGWAVDLAAADGTGVDTVHVWAYPVGGGSPVWLGVAAVGDSRPDVADLYGSQFEPSAFSLSVNRLVPGTWDIVTYVHRAKTDNFDAAQSVRVTVTK